MHTCLAVTTEGLPLGLLSNKITARESSSRQEKAGTRDRLPIEEKESYRWLEALQDTTEAMGKNPKHFQISKCMPFMSSKKTRPKERKVSSGCY